MNVFEQIDYHVMCGFIGLIIAMASPLFFVEINAWLGAIMFAFGAAIYGYHLRAITRIGRGR